MEPLGAAKVPFHFSSPSFCSSFTPTRVDLAFSMAVGGTCSAVFVLTRVAFYERTQERKEAETKVELAM